MPLPDDDPGPTPIRPLPDLAAVEIASRLLDPRPRIHVEQVALFPLDAFPSPVQSFLVASAASARVQVEMVAAPFLALAGAVIGQTGTGKSPALATVLAPFDALQERAWTDWHDNRHSERSDESPCEAHPIPPTPSRSGEARPIIPKPRPRVYTTETTIDALVHDLRDSPGIAIVRDELVGIIRGMQQSRGRRGDARQPSREREG